ASEVFRDAFYTAQGRGEVYCFRESDDAGFSFEWYFSKGKYVAVAEITVLGETWSRAYAEWLSDRDLLLAKAVPKSIFAKSCEETFTSRDAHPPASCAR